MEGWEAFLVINVPPEKIRALGSDRNSRSYNLLLKLVL
jgi:hypothetical protein